MTNPVTPTYSLPVELQHFAMVALSVPTQQLSCTIADVVG